LKDTFKRGSRREPQLSVICCQLSGDRLFGVERRRNLATARAQLHGATLVQCGKRGENYVEQKICGDGVGIGRVRIWIGSNDERRHGSDQGLQQPRACL